MHVISGGDDADQRRDGDFVSHDERYARTDEYVEILRSIWTADKPVDHLALSNGANDDRVRTKSFPFVGNRGLAIRNAFDIFLQIIYRANHTGMIFGVHEDGGG